MSFHRRANGAIRSLTLALRPTHYALSRKAGRGIIGAMTALPQARMTVDEYLTWAEGQPGRYELCDGTVYAMSPEGAGHAEVKGAVYRALLAGIRARRLPCFALPDGMTVRVDQATAFE